MVFHLWKQSACAGRPGHDDDPFAAGLLFCRGHYRRAGGTPLPESPFVFVFSLCPSFAGPMRAALAHEFLFASLHHRATAPGCLGPAVAVSNGGTRIAKTPVPQRPTARASACSLRLAPPASQRLWPDSASGLYADAPRALAFPRLSSYTPTSPGRPPSLRRCSPRVLR